MKPFVNRPYSQVYRKPYGTRNYNYNCHESVSEQPRAKLINLIDCFSKEYFSIIKPLIMPLLIVSDVVSLIFDESCSKH